MLLTPEQATSWAWVIWLASWMAAAAFSPKAARRERLSAEALHWIVTVVRRDHAAVHPSGGGRLDAPGLAHSRLGSVGRSAVERQRALGWTLFALSIAGFGFCWWARLHLGGFWSGSVTLKGRPSRGGHRPVRAGAASDLHRLHLDGAVHGRPARNGLSISPAWR